MNEDQDLQDLSVDERGLLRALAELPPIDAPPDLPARFRARLRAERVPAVAPRRWVTIALAASLVVALGGGWWLDRQRREAEVGQLRAELALALKDLSAATRMQAIATAERKGTHDDGVADALVDALLHDPSTNVRLAAAQALAIVGSPATFARGAGLAFASEQSPFVQAVLLDASRRLSPAARASLLRILLARPDLDADLRAQATKQSSL